LVNWILVSRFAAWRRRAGFSVLSRGDAALQIGVGTPRFFNACMFSLAVSSSHQGGENVLRQLNSEIAGRVQRRAGNIDRRP
jgi:hypothetical protein